jgi:hypothetical protein
LASNEYVPSQPIQAAPVILPVPLVTSNDAIRTPVPSNVMADVATSKRSP